VLSEECGYKDQLPVEVCPHGMAGDITLNCYRLGKVLREDPNNLVKFVSTFLTSHEDVERVGCIKGFVNITLHASALYRDTLADKENLLNLSLPESDRKKMVVEYSSPNTNKPQHIGHLRNNVFGSAVCSILKRVGHTVTTVNLINDRGIHICKSMAAYMVAGNGCEPSDAYPHYADGAKFVGEYYSLFDTIFQRQVQELKVNEPTLNFEEHEWMSKTEIGKLAQDLLVKWESGDLPTRALWMKMNSWVLESFTNTYARLGIKFDKTYYESEVYRFGKELVIEGGKGFYKREDGAIEVDLDNFGLGKKVLLRADGTTFYITQDIAATILKYGDYKTSNIIWITADEQIHHFEVLKAVLHNMSYFWADNCEHLPYGLISLPEGTRMSSRKGKNNVVADDLIDEVKNCAKYEIEERHSEKVLTDTELGSRAEKIAMAAIRFMLLKVNPKTKMVFDPHASIKFEGDTGPYLLYVYARINSIRSKVSTLDQGCCDWSLLVEPEERALAVQCGVYGDVLSRAANEFDPSILTSYLLNLAKAFNSFYNKHSVVRAVSPQLIRARHELCCRVQDVMGDGLNTLTIGTVEAM